MDGWMDGWMEELLCVMCADDAHGVYVILMSW